MAAAEEGFHDYTLATKLERLVAQLEQCFRGWMLTGLENISHLPPAVGPDRQPMGAVRVNSTIEHRMPWRSQPYILTLHVPYTRESDLQAAKQQQQALQLRAQQQAQQQQQQAQQQQAALKPAAAALPAPAAAPGGGGDVQQAVSVASAALAQHVAATAAAGGPAAVDKLQAQLAPLMASSNSNDGSSAAAEGGNGYGSNEQVLQQVQELIEQYRMVQLQLQAGDAQAEDEQQGEEEPHAAHSQQPPVAGGGEASAEAAALAEEAAAADKAVERSASSGSLLDVLSGLGRLGSRGAGSSGGRRVSDAAAAAVGGRAGSPESPAAPTPAGGKGSSSKTRQLNATKLSRQAASRRASSSGGGSGSAADASTGMTAAASSTGAADAAPAAVVDELDEASSRQVELPAAEELVAAGSSALAAVRAAVQQDQSRTSASRSWWPFCYSLQQHHQAGSSTPTPLRPPWWSPGAGSHKLQRWFGLDLFVLLQPASYSRRFLDAAESSSLLSVGRLALSSSGAAWPLLLPVHDALRDAYVGSAQVGALSVSFNTDSIHTSRLPRHLSATERQLQQFAEQLLPHNPAGAAACLAIIGHSSEPSLWAKSHTEAGVAPQTQQQQQQHGVWLSACSTYSLPDASRCHWLQHALAGSNDSNSTQAQAQAQQHALGAPHASDAHQSHHLHAAPDDDDAAAFEDWDADSAWHPWAQHRDPVQALELDVIWADRQLVAADDAAAAAFAAHTTATHHWQQQQHVPLSCEGMGRLLGDASAADVWLLHVLQHGFSSAPTRPGRLGVRSVERHRRHVSVAATGADWLWTAEAAQQVLAYGGRLSGVQPQPWGQAPRPDSFAGLQLDPGSFTTMLSALLTARTAAAAAHSLWELAGADWWEGHGEVSVPPLPPDSVLDSVLHDLLSPPRPAAMGGGGSLTAAAAGGSGDGQQPGTASSSNTGGSGGDACLRRSAPAGSLLCRLSLHALVFGNARAVAALWQRFMVQVRLHFWEERTLLPYLPSGHSSSSSSDAGACGGPPAPDLDSCLLHQKLQMLNVCIWRRDRRIGRRSSSSRQRPPLPPQQQQLTERSRPSSSGTINGNDSGMEPADIAATGGSAAGGGAAPRVGRSSSRSSALGLATAASSTFYSVSGDDDDDDDDDAAAAGGDADAALDDGSGWEGGETGDVSCSAAGDGNDDASSQQQLQQDEGAGDGSEDDEAAEQYADAFSSGSGGAAAASAAPAEWEQQEPRGVAGVVPGQSLLHHASRPLRVPVVQDEPVFTEDQLIQRQAALMQLAMTAEEDSSSSGAAAGQLLLKQRLLAAPLLSDMGAFKAANPGCCFEDFLRWFSPKDWQHQAAAAGGGATAAAGSDQADTATASSSHALSPAPAAAGAGSGGSSTSSMAAGQASARMCQGPANDWRQLWALAEPLPAAAQRPLLNPQKEGEQVLHYLETLSPSGLFSQLLAAAVTESLALLAASRGAALPAAATVVDRFQTMAAGVLRKGGGFSEALAATAALGEAAAPPGHEQQQQHELAGDWQGAEDGLSDVELELLLAEFAYVEQVVVLGESLLHHLPGQHQLAARLLHHLLHGCGSSADTSSSNSSGDGPDEAAAADATFEQAVLGTGSRLPVAALSLQEKAALLHWVEAAAAVEDGGGSARPGWQQQHWGAHPGSSSEGGGSASYPTLTDLAEAPEGQSGEGEQQPQQQQQQQLLAQLQGQQRSLGAPVQQEWVTTCAPITCDSSAPPHHPTGGNSGRRLAPAVAAAVAAAAAAGGPAAAAAAAVAPGRTGGSGGGGGGGEGVLVPPSRLYLQEADGEMRVASVLVAQHGA